MLVVFAIALTPWSVLHHHEPLPLIKNEKNCKHITHVKASAETCLICNASFEKNYVQTHNVYRVFLSAKIFNQTAPVLKSSFVQIKRCFLRGPPQA